jgi:hypothetical protein
LLLVPRLARLLLWRAAGRGLWNFNWGDKMTKGNNLFRAKRDLVQRASLSAFVWSFLFCGMSLDSGSGQQEWQSQCRSFFFLVKKKFFSTCLRMPICHFRWKGKRLSGWYSRGPLWNKMSTIQSWYIWAWTQRTQKCSKTLWPENKDNQWWPWNEMSLYLESVSISGALFLNNKKSPGDHENCRNFDGRKKFSSAPKLWE